MVSSRISLNQKMMLAMKGHAASTYPEECCGLLIGKFEENSTCKLVNSCKRMQNAFQEKERYHRYTIDPTLFIQAENEAASLSEEIVGIYHSHPDAPAKPSIFDLKHAWPTFSYVVIEVRKTKTVDTQSWVLKDDRSEFLLETMEVREDD